MALNLEVIDVPIKSQPFEYGPDQVILYALGIGAGCNDLPFIYEKELKVYPTFAVVPFLPALFGRFLKYVNINLNGLLHVGHKIVFHQQIPTSAILESNLCCKSIWDKKEKGALINIHVETYSENGELLFENQATVIDKTAGNFGGESGPTEISLNSLEGKTPDFSILQETSPTQAALYRLSGDKNPLHIDRTFAKKVGFNGPVLHGLCTFGFVCRVILSKLCRNDPQRLKTLSCKFAGPVYPGEKLIHEGWQMEKDKYVLKTKNQTGKIILDNVEAVIS